MVPGEQHRPRTEDALGLCTDKATGRAERLDAHGMGGFGRFQPEKGTLQSWPVAGSGHTRCAGSVSHTGEASTQRGGSASYLGPALGLAPPPWSRTCGHRATSCLVLRRPWVRGGAGGLAVLPQARLCDVHRLPHRSEQPPPVPNQRNAGESREGSEQVRHLPASTGASQRSDRQNTGRGGWAEGWRPPTWGC